jgi:hypothetical protein
LNFLEEKVGRKIQGILTYSVRPLGCSANEPLDLGISWMGDRLSRLKVVI